MTRCVYLNGVPMPCEPDSFTVTTSGIADIKRLLSGELSIRSGCGAESVVEMKVRIPYDREAFDFDDGLDADAIAAHIKGSTSGAASIVVVVGDDGGNAVFKTALTAAITETAFSYGGDAIAATVRGRCLDEGV